MRSSHAAPVTRWFWCRTEGLGGDFDASGFWFGEKDSLDDNIWNTDSTVPATPGDHAVATSWQNIVIGAGETKTIAFILGAAYRGYNQPLSSPTPSPSSEFKLSDAEFPTGGIINTVVVAAHASPAPFEVTRDVDDTIAAASVPADTDGQKSAPPPRSLEAKATDGAGASGPPARLDPSEVKVTGDILASVIVPSKPAARTDGNPASASPFAVTLDPLKVTQVAQPSKVLGSGGFATPTRSPLPTVAGTEEPEAEVLWKDWRFWAGLFGGLWILALIALSITCIVFRRRLRERSSESSAAKGAETNFAVIEPTHSAKNATELAGSQVYTQENPLFEAGSDSGSNMFLEPGSVVTGGRDAGAEELGNGVAFLREGRSAIRTGRPSARRRRIKLKS